MTEVLQQGLSITGLGMGLVFLMIIALWGIMVLLVRFTSRPKKEDKSGEEEPREQQGTGTLSSAAQAAAAAVAFALAAEKQIPTSAARVKTSPGQSQWLLSGRMRQTLHNPGKGQKR